MNQSELIAEKKLCPFAEVLFDNSYSKLPETFYNAVNPTPVNNPKTIRVNHSLCKQLGIDSSLLEKSAGYITGNLIPESAQPIALAYAGHQFGHFVHQLGDGRAILMGEVRDEDDQRFDLQWKGSGPTTYSRGGDGRAPLGPVIREYIVSEAMYALGCPTTRCLGAALTGESVYRGTAEPGAVLIRVASSHIRIGTFEYFSSRGDVEAIKSLANYTIQRHYSDSENNENPYLALLEEVLKKQALLIAHWMSIGFIHGVMNTDNMTLSGETIDYGPCAFMDEYEPDKVFSSIDRQGRYAYQNQERIALWNLTRLAESLLPLIDENIELAIEKAQTVLLKFQALFKQHWMTKMGQKIGLEVRVNENESNEKLINELLNLMHQNRSDFTLTFHYLTTGLRNGDFQAFHQLLGTSDSVEAWLTDWKNRLKVQAISQEESVQLMRENNPVFIPRNHEVERVIRAAVDNNDFTLMDALLTILETPYTENETAKGFMMPPEENERVTQTFCGT